MIRKAELSDVKQIAQVHVDSWKTTYKGIINQDYLDKIKYEDREKLWEHALTNPPTYIWIAEVNRKIVGFASGGSERTKKYGYDGELYAIYLLETFQKNGIGKELVKHLAKDLDEAGYSSLLVWVLLQNKSIPFYKSLNPVEVDSEQIKIGEQFYEEVALGWKNIKFLI